MGWYTGYKVIVHFLDEKHNNGDRLDEFTKNMKDRNLVKLICIEKNGHMILGVDVVILM
jgi:hypothetical protein